MKAMMKRAEVLSLSAIFDQLKRVRETKFAYAIARNMRLLTAEVESIREAGRLPDKFIEFEQRRLQLVGKYALRDKEGQMIMSGLNNAQIANPGEFERELAALRDEYKNAIAEARAKNGEVDDLLKSGVEIDCYEIRADVLPKELSADEMLALMPLITGDIEAALSKVA